MDKITANYTSQPNDSFPLDCETLQYISQNQSILEILGNIAGNNVILQGCEKDSGTSYIKPGYVFLRTQDYPNGEILHFAGGSSDSICLKKENIQVNALGFSYQKAYERRSLISGVGEENFNFKSFEPVTSNQKLLELIDGLRRQFNSLDSLPVGTILIWPSKSLPSSKFVFCHGQSLPLSDVSLEFHLVIGDAFGVPEAGKIKMPDMRNRFVVGCDQNYTAYPFGSTGGLSSVQLTVDQMPNHNHSIAALDAINGTEQTIKPLGYINGHVGSGKIYTESTGGGKAHENRPPYIALNYIIKVR